MTTRFQQNAATILLAAIVLALILLEGFGMWRDIGTPDWSGTAIVGGITAIAGIARPGGESAQEDGS